MHVDSDYRERPLGNFLDRFLQPVEEIVSGCILSCFYGCMNTDECEVHPAPADSQKPAAPRDYCASIPLINSCLFRPTLREATGDSRMVILLVLGVPDGVELLASARMYYDVSSECLKLLVKDVSGPLS